MDPWSGMASFNKRDKHAAAASVNCFTRCLAVDKVIFLKVPRVCGLPSH